MSTPPPDADDSETLTNPEQTLLDHLRNGQPCSFLGEGEGRPGDPEVDKTEWGMDRTVRASVLKAMLLHSKETWGLDGIAVDLRGAVVTGNLGGFADSSLAGLRLAFCRIDGEVDFSKATFTGEADFRETTFTGDATFNDATFKGEAKFNRATLAGKSNFDRATFEDHAAFGEAAFAQGAFFENATFKRNAGFNSATFVGLAYFGTATFGGAAWFDGVAAAENIIFTEATFTADAVFSQAAYTELITFQGAKFLGTVDFTNSIADEIRFLDTTFSTDEPGPCVAAKVSLEGASLNVRTRFTITATEIYARGLQAREGAYLVVCCPAVDLSDSEFLRPSIVSSLPHGPQIPTPFDAQSSSDKTRRQEERDKAEAKALQLRGRLTREKTDTNTASTAQDPEQPPGQPEEQHSAQAAVHATSLCHLTSLTRANIGELVLSDVVLDDCEFVGALGLDKLRIGPGCSFRLTPRWRKGRWLKVRWPKARYVANRWRKSEYRKVQWRKARDVANQWRKSEYRKVQWRKARDVANQWRKIQWWKDQWRNGHWLEGRVWKARRLARRRIIAEEINWRKAHVANAAGTKKLDFLPAPDIAEIYRDLRNGLEEGKNEPGAADFYYGEMEMRRLAAREPTVGSTDRRRRPPSRAERALLNGYWAASGYGLRASPSLVTLAVLLIGAALLYTSPSFAIATPQPPTQITKGDTKSGLVTSTQPPSGAAPHFLSTLDYSARESISLLQNRGDSTVTPKGPGKILDIILRLAGPVLLALSVLAFRARIRR
jgi:hypothetical protein